MVGSHMSDGCLLGCLFNFTERTQFISRKGCFTMFQRSGSITPKVDKPEKWFSVLHLFLGVVKLKYFNLPMQSGIEPRSLGLLANILPRRC